MLLSSLTLNRAGLWIVLSGAGTRHAGCAYLLCAHVIVHSRGFSVLVALSLPMTSVGRVTLTVLLAAVVPCFFVEQVYLLKCCSWIGWYGKVHWYRWSVVTLDVSCFVSFAAMLVLCRRLHATKHTVLNSPIALRSSCWMGTERSPC